jgi:hypothetical protein
LVIYLVANKIGKMKQRIFLNKLLIVISYARIMIQRLDVFRNVFPVRKMRLILQNFTVRQLHVSKKQILTSIIVT